MGDVSEKTGSGLLWNPVQKAYEGARRGTDELEDVTSRASSRAKGGIFEGEDWRGTAKDVYEKSLRERSGFGVEDVESGMRERYGLEGDKLFEYATRLSDVAEGREKTQGQIRSERALEILTGAQRGVAASNTGFDAAQSLRTGERAAQRSEAEGEAQIGAAAQLAQEQYGATLEQLLIAGEQRAEDKKSAMAQIQMQAEAAEGAMFGNVLSGILGALGTIAGAPGGPAGMAAGGAAGSALGQGIGRWVA